MALHNRLAVQRGWRLLWLVFGSGLAAVATILYHSIELVFFVVWLILCFFIFRGQGWARWIVVFILAAIGLPLTELALEGFLFVLTVLHVFSLDVLRGRWHPDFLRIRRLFAERRGMPAIGDWSQTALAPPPEQNIRGSQLALVISRRRLFPTVRPSFLVHSTHRLAFRSALARSD